ncbi:MAG: hypothetical protein QM648_03290 [Solirubrobacterales bacterium]
MRDRMLHDSLRALTDDASRLLEDLLSAGAEIPFEVGESGESPGMRGSVTMFAYRPLTAEFVSSHADQLRRLPSFENAAQNLARTRGVIAYLRVRNEPVLDVGELTHARLGVLAFLASVWRDAERFEYWGDRFERAYAELESVALAERLVTTVFIPIHGVALSEGRINLGAGVEIVALEELDPACADRFSDSVAGADSFCSISVTAPSDAPTPMPAVRLSARALLTALRLFRPGSVAMAMTAQADIMDSWHQVSMPFSGRSHEAAWMLTPSDEEELRQFVNAVRRVERRTRISWALKRFETGLERTVPADGLTDFLLALRALLEAEDDRGKAALPARISALCAQDHERITVREEIEAAFALERLAIDGHVGRADRKRLEKLPPLETIASAERHLRALLHDLVCGYLSTDLKSLADEILTADGEPAGDDIAPHEPVYLEPVPAPGEAPAADPTETVEFEAVFDDTAEIKALDMRDDVAAFHADEDAAPEADDNVWTLRPADELAPAPEVTPEPEVIVEPTPIAETAPEPIVEATDPLSPPAWESAPERRPVPSRRPAAESDPATGFTFDFKNIEAERGVPAPVPAARTESSEVPIASGPAFPIPEFGVPIGRGPAARRSDEEVDGREQHENFREIMDENFEHPSRPEDEVATTPVGRDGRPHLFALEGDPDQSVPAAPRIVHPSQTHKPLILLDPEMTVEYDVLGAETSAEETAQLAWSEQFLRRSEDDETIAPG